MSRDNYSLDGDQVEILLYDDLVLDAALIIELLKNPEPSQTILAHSLITKNGITPIENKNMPSHEERIYLFAPSQEDLNSFSIFSNRGKEINDRQSAKGYLEHAPEHARKIPLSEKNYSSQMSGQERAQQKNQIKKSKSNKKNFKMSLWEHNKNRKNTASAASRVTRNCRTDVKVEYPESANHYTKGFTANSSGEGE